MLKHAAKLLPVARAQVCDHAEVQLLSVRGINFFNAPNGPSVKQVSIEDEWYNRQRNIFQLLDKQPYFPVDVFVAPNAVVCGDVDIYGGASIFFGAVLRGDLNKIRLGNRSAVLDRAVIHAARAVPTGLNAATLIGDKVTVEPYAVLRSCRVEPKCIIGARSVLCEGSVVEAESIVAPNSVVPPARRIPSGELWGGNPVKFIRKLTAHERDRVLDDVANHYHNLAAMFRREQLDHGTAWRDVEAWRQKLVDHGEYQWINFREQKYLMRLQHEAEAMEKLAS
ncbi:hypothetical protein VOLCADRAFT_72782 [Volvox carteri f. nagariensis]|uniref:Uncharacterized protein cag2 n=1 Tax=Volvox carteri f. nagariensis TaxID=3068 RepID=D8TJI6_VOLCA|nr:uncharacterized protein VOLCADRAFT_72782 [Volvox carteri f. nagariensis]EFJ52549.1 hypothetical protein VOLCADRAFT_72782 [Volvox carteri f. nagariensis]|eukprot:XP_002946622.1 hypothetical protein VOLCADRAFT_72782 [Volvox carteri f. nagariensis]